MELMKRKDVPEELTWDLSYLYAGKAELETAMAEAEAMAAELEKKFKGRLTDVRDIQDCLDGWCLTCETWTAGGRLRRK